MNKGYRERENYQEQKDKVKVEVPGKDGHHEKGESEKIADRIPTPQGEKKQ